MNEGMEKEGAGRNEGQRQQLVGAEGRWEDGGEQRGRKWENGGEQRGRKRVSSGWVETGAAAAAAWVATVAIATGSES